MAQQPKPTDFGGWGRKGGLDGGLTGVEFSSRCPPAVKPGIRIIAVCGINDISDNSSPQNDGWFHSDFFLFHHLFSGLGSNQHWLTCVSPAVLVAKYGAFVHGNRLDMRRIVLDDKMLPDIRAAKNVRVIQPVDLLERFLATIRDECRLAVSRKESILILIFGHGDLDTYGVAIGGKGSAEAAPRLTIDKLNAAIGKTANVSLIMTSCFSGGWVIQETRDESKATVNATMMTAAGPEKLSESWAKSESTGRAAGSIFASAVVKAAIQMQTKDAGEVDRGKLEEEITSSPAYVEWVKFIHDVGRNEVDRLFWRHDIKFAAKNDSWGSEWGTVSGLPPADYKARWEMLRTIPKDIAANPLSNRDPNANTELDMASLSIGESGSGYLGEKFQGSFVSIVREQAKQYLNSFPGNDALGCNSDHSHFRTLVQGKIFDKEYLEYLSNVLCYRISAIKQATDMKYYFQLPIEEGHLFDTTAWEHKLLESAYIKGVDEAKVKAEWKRYENIRSMITKAGFLNKPARSQGLFYSKPSEYLAIGFYKSGRTDGQISNGIGMAVLLQQTQASYFQDKVLGDPIVQNRNHKFFRRFNSLKTKA